MGDGYWPRINGRDSALAAVRMAGLPVFLIGGTTLLFVLIAWGAAASLGETLAYPLQLVMAAGCGAALVILGLALRGGRTALVPVATGLTLLNAAATVLLFAWWFAPVQALMALLALSGLRGWWWLRNDPA